MAATNAVTQGTVADTTVESDALDEDLESSPLLSNGRRRPTPLPVVQLLILGLVLLAEPISYTQVS